MKVVVFVLTKIGPKIEFHIQDYLNFSKFSPIMSFDKKKKIKL